MIYNTLKFISFCPRCEYYIRTVVNIVKMDILPPASLPVPNSKLSCSPVLVKTELRVGRKFLGVPVGPDGLVERHDLEPVRGEVECRGQLFAPISHK